MTYKDALLLKRMLRSDEGWLALGNMKRPRFWEFWKKKEWARRMAEAKAEFKKVLRQEYFEVDD